MRCPFRKVTKHKKNITKEHYAKCYEKECPYYGSLVVGTTNEGDIKTEKRCRKVEWGTHG
jgi:hypothetical protein